MFFGDFLKIIQIGKGWLLSFSWFIGGNEVQVVLFGKIRPGVVDGDEGGVGNDSAQVLQINFRVG